MTIRHRICKLVETSRKEVEASALGRHVPLQVVRMSAVHDGALLLSLPRRNGHLRY